MSTPLATLKRRLNAGSETAMPCHGWTWHGVGSQSHGHVRTPSLSRLVIDENSPAHLAGQPRPPPTSICLLYLALGVSADRAQAT